MPASDLELMVGTNETILWRGRPHKKCFILESIFNPLLPFALIWAVVDAIVFGVIAFSGGPVHFVVMFLAVHLMPVYIYIGGVVLSFRKYRNTAYIITDKGIYVSGGTFSFTYEMKPFTDLSHINIRRGIWDQMLGVGDVISVCSHSGLSSGHSHASGGLTICDIPDYQNVFNLIKQLQTDIYADTQYPNDLRPKENHGYQTQYVRRDD